MEDCQSCQLWPNEWKAKDYPKCTCEETRNPPKFKIGDKVVSNKDNSDIRTIKSVGKWEKWRECYVYFFEEEDLIILETPFRLYEEELKV